MIQDRQDIWTKYHSQRDLHLFVSIITNETWTHNLQI